MIAEKGKNRLVVLLAFLAVVVGTGGRELHATHVQGMITVAPMRKVFGLTIFTSARAMSRVALHHEQGSRPAWAFSFRQ
jgi:hypothetical protein